jgi:hypothetical protein
MTEPELREKSLNLILSQLRNLKLKLLRMVIFNEGI